MLLTTKLAGLIEVWSSCCVRERLPALQGMLAVGAAAMSERGHQPCRVACSGSSCYVKEGLHVLWGCLWWEQLLCQRETTCPVGLLVVGAAAMSKRHFLSYGVACSGSSCYIKEGLPAVFHLGEGGRGEAAPLEPFCPPWNLFAPPPPLPPPPPLEVVKFIIDVDKCLTKCMSMRVCICNEIRVRMRVYTAIRLPFLFHTSKISFKSLSLSFSVDSMTFSLSWTG